MKLPKSLYRDSSSILTRDEARDLLSPHVDDLIDAVREGMKLMSKFPAALRVAATKRTLANLLNDLIVSEAVKRFDGAKGVKIDRDCRFVAFLFGESAILRHLAD